MRTLRRLALALLAATSVFGQTTNIVRRDITWTVSGSLTLNVDYGQYANGDWWVVGPITLVSVSPAPTSTENGTVIDPVWAYGGGSQGFDASVGSVTYNAALNIYDQFPKSVPANSSVVSTISAATNVTYGDIDRMEILTVVSDTPAANSFRPPYIGRNAGALLENWTTADLNYDALGDYDISGLGGLPDIATYAAQFERVWYEQITSFQGRFLHPEQHMPDYGREMANITGNAGILLNGNYSDAQKEDLLINFVQYGIDIYGVLYAGGKWSADGGHNNGRLMPLLIAAATLGDANMAAYLDADYGGSGKFQEFQQTFFVTQADVDQWRYTADGRPRTAYTAEDIGKPEWGEKHESAPQRDGDNWDAYYRGNGGGRLQAPALVAKLMGYEDEIGAGDAFFAYAERHIYYYNNRYDNPIYYNGWDDGDAYGEGNTGSTDPFSANHIPSFHNNFYLAFESADPVGSAPDVTAPSISNVSVTKTDTTASIAWNTNEGATSVVEWDTDSGAPYANTDSVAGYRSSHSVDLTGPLTASTTYYYRIVTEDSSGNSTTGSEQSFATDAAGLSPAGTPSFSPVGGSYWQTQSVTISASPSDAIEYTTDGTAPDGDDLTYSSPVSVSDSAASVRLRARSTASGYSASAVATADYRFSPWAVQSDQWINIGYPAQTAAFTETVYAIISESTSTDVVIGFGVSANNYNDLAIMWRFSDAGVIEARNGGSYTAVNAVSWQTGTQYAFAVSDVVWGVSYDLSVSVEGGAPIVIANDYAWRSDWTGSATIDTLAAYDSLGNGATLFDTGFEVIASSAPPVRRVRAKSIGVGALLP